MPFVIAEVSCFNHPVFKVAALNLIDKGIDIVVVPDKHMDDAVETARKGIELAQTGQSVRHADLDAILDLLVDLDPYTAATK